MFEVAPYPHRWPGGEHNDEPEPGSVAVVVPTRDRPYRLARCLEALERARRLYPFEVIVCDSSGVEHADRVAEACAQREFVRLVSHDRTGAAAARNVGTQAATAELVVALDDDVYVEPEAISELVETYRAAGGGLKVIAGAVRWSRWTSAPLRMRAIGFGREARVDEEVEFLVSALILYPRRLALELPWNERLWPYDDRFATLIWRAAGATLHHAPGARATHDQRESRYLVGHHADRIYVNLVDALLIERSAERFAAFELLSFAACARGAWPSPRAMAELCRAWARGHLRFFADRKELAKQVRKASAIAAGGG